MSPPPPVEEPAPPQSGTRPALALMGYTGRRWLALLPTRHSKHGQTMLLARHGALMQEAASSPWGPSAPRAPRTRQAKPGCRSACLNVLHTHIPRSPHPPPVAGQTPDQPRDWGSGATNCARRYRPRYRSGERRYGAVPQEYLRTGRLSIVRSSYMPQHPVSRRFSRRFVCLVSPLFSFSFFAPHPLIFFTIPCPAVAICRRPASSLPRSKLEEGAVGRSWQTGWSGATAQPPPSPPTSPGLSFFLVEFRQPVTPFLCVAIP